MTGTTDLPLKVTSAIALARFLKHENVIGFLKAGLHQVLMGFLSIMDTIDYDGLVKALQRIVECFEDSIAPDAMGLCEQLSKSYVRLILSKGSGEQEDQEAGLTS